MCLYANQVENDWWLKKITNKVGQFMLILISIILTINLFQTIFKNYCTFIWACLNKLQLCLYFALDLLYLIHQSQNQLCLITKIIKLSVILFFLLFNSSFIIGWMLVLITTITSKLYLFYFKTIRWYNTKHEFYFIIEVFQSK